MFANHDSWLQRAIEQDTLTPRQPNRHSHRPHLSLESFHARATTRARLRERRKRARRIQTRVWVATVAVFVCSWAVIAVQMAAGQDPALVADARIRAVEIAKIEAADRALLHRERVAARRLAREHDEAAARRAAAAAAAARAAEKAAAKASATPTSSSATTPTTTTPTTTTQTTTQPATTTQPTTTAPAAQTTTPTPVVTSVS
jgi:hypothetical protein